VTQPDAIAVIGLAARVPGAEDVDQFWRNLLDEVDAVRSYRPEELRAAGVSERLLADPRYVCAAGHLDGLTDFDAEFFGYPAAEAALIDPQHRLFLEVAWAAFEDAGYDPGVVEAVGVFAGASVNRYFLTHLLGNPAAGPVPEPGDWEALMPPGHSVDYLPLRVSYKLGLTGPSVATQAACASSLVAVCQAAQSLLDFRCDLALAGGASVLSPEPAGYLARDSGLLSPDGVLRAFDAGARGTVYGSGAGAVLLKRLADAEADGDHVHAVIRGWAVTNDGSARAGFAAPGVTGLAIAIVEALACADLDPTDIGYVEAHGSGTPVGDAIEVRALTQAFAGVTGPCGIGSVKTNIGNLDAAAGVLGLIKAVLAVRHGLVPATLHFTAPHPDLNLTVGPFQVVAKTQPWSGPDARRAGVNAVGLGGTNAHVVVEEPPRRPDVPPPAGHWLLPVSARTPEALHEATTALARRLRAADAPDLADAAYTLSFGRRHFAVRTAALAADLDEAVRALDGAMARVTGVADPAASLVLIFPDRPSCPDAALRYAADPGFRRHVDDCGEAFVSATGDDPRADLAAAQPAAAFAVGYALAAQLVGLGLRPRAVAGDGSGRYAAACIAGALGLPEAIAAICSDRPVEGGQPGTPLLAVADALSIQGAVPVVVGPAGPAYGPDAVAALDGRGDPLATVAACWLRGLSPDWTAVHAGRSGRRVALPTYPFQRQRHWIDLPPTATTPGGRR